MFSPIEKKRNSTFRTETINLNNFEVNSRKMLRTTEVRISENIKGNFTPLIYIFRAFGIFPMKIKKDKIGLFLKWSPWVSVYSYLFVSTMLVMCLCGSINQKFMEIIKLDGRSVIDNIVSMFPMIGYCTGAFFGVFYMASKVTQFLTYFNIINQVDSIIKTEYSRLDKYKSLFVPLITFLNSETIHFLNILIYKTLVGSKLEVAQKVFIKHTPYLLNIYISLLAEYLIRLMTYNLELRFIRLNNILQDNYLMIRNREKVGFNKSLAIIEIPDGDRGTGLKERRSEENEDNEEEVKEKLVKELLSYNKVYLKLIEAADIINHLAGINILVVLVATFTDLITTSYFIILILGGKPQGRFELLTVVSIFTYGILKVLVITEPLYDCMGTIKDTSTQICKLLSLNIGPDFRRQAKVFAVTIYLTETAFTACGLFTIDRFMIATLIGGVTNYVAILLGFKENSK